MQETPARATYDAIIVGARCAGAATALLLAQSGVRTLVIDRTKHGSDTLSTHALMRGGVLQLHRWGVLDQVRASGAPAVSTTTFHYDKESVEVVIKPRDGIDALYAPRRTVLDAVLAEAAAAAGAEISRGPKVVDLVRGPQGRVLGAVIEDRPGHFREVGANIVVGADGARSTVARLAGAQPLREGFAATGVVYGYFEGLDLPGYNWYFRPGVSAGAIATNGGTLIFASMPQRRFWEETRFDLPAGFRRVLRETSPALAEGVAGARQVGGFRGYAGRCGYLRQSWGPGWALAGDAGYFKDPITAHGITDALRDAELLARAITIGGLPSLAEYQQTRDELSLRLFEITDAIASFDWDFEKLQQLHRDMSEEMKKEVRHLLSLDAHPKREALVG